MKSDSAATVEIEQVLPSGFVPVDPGSVAPMATVWIAKAMKADRGRQRVIHPVPPTVA